MSPFSGKGMHYNKAHHVHLHTVLMAGFSYVGSFKQQDSKGIEKKEINLQFSRKRWDGGFSVKLYWEVGNQ